MNNEQMRADFEQAYALTDKTADFRRAAINGHEYYFDDEHRAWQFWQTATLKATMAERERCAKEAEHWQTVSTTPGHVCGQFIADAIRLPLPPTGTEQS